MDDTSKIGLFETPLEYIETILQDEDIKTELCPPEEKNHLEVLYAILGRDSQDRGYALQLYYLNEASEQLVLNADEMEVYHLRMTCVFPFQVTEGAEKETMEAVLTLNRFLPLGALGYSARDRAVLLEYTLTLPSQEIEEKLLLEIFYMLQFFTPQFAEILEPLCLGQATIEDLTEQIKKLFDVEPPSVLPFPGFPEK